MHAYLVDMEKYTNWRAYYNKDVDIDEFGPDYDFSCVEWRASLIPLLQVTDLEMIITSFMNMMTLKNIEGA